MLNTLVGEKISYKDALDTVYRYVVDKWYSSIYPNCCGLRKEFYLFEDIVTLFRGKSVSEQKLLENEILEIINSTEWAEEILSKIFWDKIIEDYKVRSDFATAFKKVKKGSDLVNSLFFIVKGFRSDMQFPWLLETKDIKNLIRLYRQNRFRTKIESLLFAADGGIIAEYLQQHKYKEILNKLDRV